jgi:hypothetical protein
MSGVVSGISKVFTSVGSAAARVGQAVMGVGRAVFTAGAATGAGPMGAGGFTSVLQNLTGSGVLGNMLTGAITQAGYGALLGGAIGAITGQGFGKGALIGGLGGAVTGGLGGLAGAAGVDTGIVTGSTPTGMASTGSTAPGPSSIPGLPDANFNARVGGPPVNLPVTPPGMAVPAAGGGWGGAAAGGGGGGFWNFLQSPTGGNLIAGLGQGLMEGMAAKERREAAEADRQFLLDKEQRLRDSYNVSPSVLHGPVAEDTGRPKPSEKYARPRYQYDPASGMIVTVPV